jgi:hypothetical protein
MADIGTAVQNIMQLDPNVVAVTVIDLNGSIIMQTENWNLVNDIPGIMSIWSQGGGSLSIQGISYIALEVIPERIIGTNVRGQGSIVALRLRSGAIIAYVSPQGDARSALTAMIEATKGL